MDIKDEKRDPVEVYILQNKGYVWNADDALWLRKSCSIIGAMVGGVSTFKQQNSVHGLPLQLTPDEVTLAVEKGWAVVKSSVGGFDDHQLDGLMLKGEDTIRANKRKWAVDFDDDDDDDDDDQYDDDGDYGAEPPPSAPWQDALAKGSHFIVPTTLEEARKAQNLESTNAGRDEEQTPSKATWTYPSTAEDKDRYLIFRDLHSKGFCITGGSKFGADFLLYPGDPTLYHAQFCVRIVPVDDNLLPALLASACRGSFQARKHLLMASVEKGSDRIQYLTFGPVDGFG